MLPEFRQPVWWRLTRLPGADRFLPLLTLEAAEFAAVLGQPISFSGEGHDPHRDIWDVVLDPAVDAPTLRSHPVERRLVLAIRDPSSFIGGVNLLHSLAHAGDDSVGDTEAASYAEAFARIRDEVANIYPSMELRGIDWRAITERYRHLEYLEGPEFWEQASQWVAQLGDAHTQLITTHPRFHPPYVAAMAGDGARLLRVPPDSEAWAAGVRPGDRLVVDDPGRWLRTVGASPQHHAMVAARRFLTMSAESRELTALVHGGRRVTWTETRRPRPGVVAQGNLIRISSIGDDLPTVLRASLNDADPSRPLTIDLRANVGGSLVAAAEARRLLVRDAEPFGAIRFTTGQGTLAEPVPLRTTPHPDAWPGEVRVLIDAMTYSAAEDFLHPLVGAPHVRILGSASGGGSGRPHTRLIKDGVRLATSTAVTYTRAGAPIEYLGIQPDELRSARH